MWLHDIRFYVMNRCSAKQTNAPSHGTMSGILAFDNTDTELATVYPLALLSLAFPTQNPHNIRSPAEDALKINTGIINPLSHYVNRFIEVFTFHPGFPA